MLDSCRVQEFAMNRCHRLYQKLSDGLVNASSRNTLTKLLAVFDSLLLAHIVRFQLVLANVVADCHAPTADAA
jgi:hypothetical protein